jgi:hypothetical protein
MIITQTKVPWLTRPNYDMWAPDCVFKNGKYYFYFPVGGRIGVATADKPEGPYTVLDKPVTGARGIDPCCLIDKDGSAYLFTSMNRISCVKLKDNMIEADTQNAVFSNLNVDRGLLEGPFAFERNGKYYLTYPHALKTERIEYAMADKPMGPYTYKGVIMDESPSGCWTNHHSLVQFKGQWYFFYHDKDLSPKFDKNRSVKIDSLFFNADGTIQKVIPTHRGVGLTNASSQIQIDRFSSKSDTLVAVELLDTANAFKGWKTTFSKKDSWIKYNSVDFGKDKYKSVNIMALSDKGATFQIKLNDSKGPVVAEVKIPAGKEWANVKTKVKGLKGGVQHIVVCSADNNNASIDWVSFEK